MPDIFHYLDYREFLNDFYKHKKGQQSYFSIRYIASRTDVDPAHVARIFSGKRHVSNKNIAAFMDVCEFNRAERRFFQKLVAFNKARTETERQTTFEELMACSSIPYDTLTPAQYEFYKRWHYTSLRALIAIHPFQSDDYDALAEAMNPAITPRQAKLAVELLLKLGLIKINEQNTLELTSVHISTGESWNSLAIRQYQESTLDLTRNALDTIKRDLRDISTVTTGIGIDDLPKFREIIREFRANMIRLAMEKEDPDEVYQLNIQFFPVSQLQKWKIKKTSGGKS